MNIFHSFVRNALLFKQIVMYDERVVIIIFPFLMEEIQLSIIQYIFEVNCSLRKLIITFIILMVIGIASGIYYFTGYRQSMMEFPQHIVMETHTNEQYAFKDMEPKIRLLEFMYTNCPDICPNTTFQMAQLRDQFVEDGVFGDRVEFITITIDPYVDTIEQLQKYASSFDIDKSEGWYVLRGSVEDTKEVADKFNFLYKDPGTGFYIHNSFTYLLDDNNKVIEVFGMGEGSFHKDKVYKRIQKELKN